MRVATILLILITLNYFSYSQKDTIKEYKTNSVDVISIKPLNIYDLYLIGTNYNNSIFDKNANSLIRRGLNFTQDIYSEGFKRSDIKITIDGEQYHSACPNRMDSPASRINPLEMESVDISHSCCNTGSGIYGNINYKRKSSDSIWRIISYISSNLVSQNEYDGSLSINGLSNTLLVRYAFGNPYLTAENKSFKDLYGYKDNIKYDYLSSSIRGNYDNFHYGFSFSNINNLSFPYLQMDEKYSKVFSANLSYLDNKLYFNYTEHLMNNANRVSSVFMETIAKNLTIGLVGEYYEIVYRKWNADNIFKTSQVTINNFMLPSVNQITSTGFYKFDIIEDLFLSVKGGINYYKLGNDANLDFYKLLYSNAKLDKLNLIGGINLTYLNSNDYFNYYLSTELGIDNPEAEQLYISVKKPSTTPNWSGNPELNQPIKINFRAEINNDYFRITPYFNYIYNYVNVIADSIPYKKIQTYGNINAIITGINFNFKYKFFESDISYIYGENTTKKQPLSEIMPLSITNNFTLPEFYDIKTYIVHRYENAQTRVDKDLKELSSNSWNTISLRLSYKISDLSFYLDLENILNTQYYRYLSYSRNPFTSGIKIYEPGRSIRLTLFYDNILK